MCRKNKETHFGKLDSFISELTKLSPEEQRKYGESCRLGSLEAVTDTHCLVPEVYLSQNSEEKNKSDWANEEI